MSSPANTKKIIALVLRFIARLIINKKSSSRPIKPLDSGN